MLFVPFGHDTMIVFGSPSYTHRALKLEGAYVDVYGARFENAFLPLDIRLYLDSGRPS